MEQQHVMEKDVTPLSVYIVPRRQVEALTSTPPIPQADLNEYLSVRQGIMSDGACDIFQKNCRSETQHHTAFELFKIVDHIESGTVVVLPFWLELFENYGCRHHIATCINWLKATYSDNPVVIQWNHDRDQATVPELQDLPSNVFVLTYNTSHQNATDILLPFWNIETRSQWNPDGVRQCIGGFIGYVGGIKVRQAMMAAFNRDGWELSDTVKNGAITESDYLWHMRKWDFALCPRGGGLSSYRLYEAIQQGCIPILFADDAALPYPNMPWGEIICRIPEKDAGDFDLIWDLVGSINVKQRRRRIAEVRYLFTLGGVQEFIYRQLKDYLE